MFYNKQDEGQCSGQIPFQFRQEERAMFRSKALENAKTIVKKAQSTAICM